MIIARWRLNRTTVSEAIPWGVNEERVSHSYRMTLICTETLIERTFEDIRIPYFTELDMARLVKEFKQFLDAPYRYRL